MAHGFVVVLRRTGAEGSSFPVVTSSCLMGRHSECDVRVQLPTVSRQHCRLDIAPDGQAWLTALATVNPPLLNGVAVGSLQRQSLAHGDVISVADRRFLWQYPDGSPLRTASPAQPDRALHAEKENHPGHGDAAAAKAEGKPAAAACKPAATGGSGGRYFWLGLGVTALVAVAAAVLAHRPRPRTIRLDIESA